MLKDHIETTKTLVSKGELSDAIAFLKQATVGNHKLQHDLINLDSILNRGKSNFIRNLIEEEKYSVIISQVTFDLLNILLEYTEGAKPFLTDDIVVDRLKLAKAQQDYQERLKAFMVSYQGANDTMIIVEKFFDDMPSYVVNTSSVSGMEMVHLRHPMGIFNCIVNFARKGSLQFKWISEYTTAIEYSKLTCTLFNQGTAFDAYYHPQDPGRPKVIEVLIFEPTIDMDDNIKWSSMAGNLLSIEELRMQCFNLIAKFLEKN